MEKRVSPISGGRKTGQLHVTEEIRTFSNIILSSEELMLLSCGVEEDLTVLWTARRSNQSNLKEISPEYSLERLMLKLKLQYLGHLVQIADSFEKTLMLGKIEGWRRKG